MSRIAKVEVGSVVVNPDTVWRHLILTTESGAVGVGEYTLNGPMGRGDNQIEGLDELALQMGSQLQGEPLDLGVLSRLGPLPHQDFVKATLWSACNQAVTALCAIHAQRPVHGYLAATPSRRVIPLYANINRASRDRTAESFAAHAQAAVQQGFSALKLAPFDGLEAGMSASSDGLKFIDRGFERIDAVRRAVGTATDIFVDCHWRFSQESILAILPQLQELGVVWLECPLVENPENIPPLRRVRSRCNDLGMRLCGLETTIGHAGYLPYLEGAAYDVVMPDIKHAGGYHEILEIAQSAHALGTSVSLHNPSGPIAHMASVHLSALLPGSERLEHQFNEAPVFHQLTEPPVTVEGGLARVPDAVGLGVSYRSLSHG